jgi:O-antigen/teichoic acid export membrane protein
VSYSKRIYLHFMQDSLYRNSIYLLANLGITSAAGFLYVLISTHLYSKADVGYATVLIGALGLASAVANLGMNRTIVRFFGASKTKSQDFITKTAMVAGASVLVGLVLSYFFKSFGIKQPSVVMAVVFIVATVFASIKVFFDNVFIATRTASGTLIENSIFSLLKVVFPIVLVSAGFMGMFGAQAIAYMAAVVVSILILKTKLGLTLRTRPSSASMRGKWNFALGSYMSDLVGGLPASVLPIIVVGRLGAVSGALWYAVMQLINFLLMVNSSINQAMFAELTNATPTQLMRLVKKTAMAMYGLLIPLCTVVFLFSDQILKVFGSSYGSAAYLLRLMSVFALIGAANYISGSIIAFYKKVFYLTIVNVANAIVVLLYCIGFAHNLTGIAIGWMLGEVVNVVLFVGGCLYILKQNSAGSKGGIEGVLHG